MESMKIIHDKVFQALEERRLLKVGMGEELKYTLRQNNRYRRLEQGFWFYGDDNYLAVSFWTGFDWKNRTPNLYLVIKKNGSISFEISVKDSLAKVNIVEKYFVGLLELRAKSTDVWYKEYTCEDYLEALGYFLKTDKIKIDKIMEAHIQDFESEDKRNRIGFITTDNFNKSLIKILRYREPSSLSRRRYSLKKLKIESYGPIKSLEIKDIPSDAPMIIFVGDNGSGKTSILKSIATNLSIQNYHEKSSVNTPYLISCGIYDGSRTYSQKIDFVKKDSFLSILVPFAGYGPSRLITDNRIKRKNPIQILRSKPLRSLFYPDAILQDFNKWLPKKIASQKNQIDEEYISEIFENAKQLLVEKIPNLYDIREGDFDGEAELTYYETDFEGEKIPEGVSYENLSSGLKSLIALLGDMMVRLFEQQPMISDISELRGIVLIDELDIHLHPRWQKQLPMILTDNFPKIQFIVTTHSPIPLLGVPKNCPIYLVKREAELGVTVERMDEKVMFSSILPNAILTSPIFGMDEMTPISKNSGTMTNPEDDYGDIQFYRRIESEIEYFLTNKKQQELIEIFKREK